MAIEVKLDELLRSRNMTVQALADEVGITISNIFVLKNGRAKAIRFSTLNAICVALNCHPGDVLVYHEDIDSVE